MDSISYTRTFVDCLITELAQYQLGHQGQTQIPQAFPGLSALPTSLKPLMLTLHCLFPNDFLPALDILDRKLVRQIMRMNQCDATTSNPDTPTARLEPEDIFLVISASAPPSSPDASSTRPPTREQEKGYEVRLRAWNCSCPTFTLSVYRDSFPRPESVTANHPSVGAAGPNKNGLPEYSFGGMLACDTTWVSPPACKHILACLLYVRCPELFGVHGHGRVTVSMEEIAGWCAGWGG
ncbi:hypothetical protein N7457_001067 [Penicillium paradoxum]|uniref:uncharacterized protein n=1 Tax=Penicillium paradoxum TaxID=176176 RepID=UPI0025465D07|nr:uncharacterized protein N7457_001067 [Penicillium paradoxum]KAJ5794468.1 hypothetical protein N7457_001067 [Penicillium paradoxum]